MGRPAALYLSAESADSVLSQVLMNSTLRLAAMPKIVWLALLCAPLVGALFILTTIIKAGTPPDRPAMTRTTVGATPSEKNDDSSPTKADRLPLSGPRYPNRDADNRKLTAIEVEQAAAPPQTISPEPPLISKPAPTKNVQPQTRRQAVKSHTVSKRDRLERVQQAPVGAAV